MNNKFSINFINEKIKFSFKGKRSVKKWILETIENEKCSPGSICYVFCSDDYLLEMNKKYLQHDYYTDILTFGHSSVHGKRTKTISGDLFISISRVKDNALHLGIHFELELKRVMIHGLLHLLGYSDKGTVRKREMKEKEDLYLSRYTKIK
jgi:probable rRNA maturation factor